MHDLYECKSCGSMVQWWEINGNCNHQGCGKKTCRNCMDNSRCGWCKKTFCHDHVERKVFWWYGVRYDMNICEVCRRSVMIR